MLHIIKCAVFGYWCTVYDHTIRRCKYILTTINKVSFIRSLISDVLAYDKKVNERAEKVNKENEELNRKCHELFKDYMELEEEYNELFDYDE